jgi:hypothetical protein
MCRKHAQPRARSGFYCAVRFAICVPAAAAHTPCARHGAAAAWNARRAGVCARCAARRRASDRRRMVRTHPLASTLLLVSITSSYVLTAGRRSCRTDRTRSTRSRTSARRRSTSFACRTSRAREAAASRACAAYCLSVALAAVRARPSRHALPLATRKAPARSRERDARRRGAGSCAQAPTVAALLCAGALLGVVRGRTEVGPRALGHRSLLMSAEHADAKRRMNQACSCPLVASRAARGLACLSATAERVCDSRLPILLYGAGEAPAVVPAGRTCRSARRAASPRRGRIACGAIPCCVGLPGRCAAPRGSGRRILVPCPAAWLVCLFARLLSRERAWRALQRPALRRSCHSLRR